MTHPTSKKGFAKTAYARFLLHGCLYFQQKPCIFWPDPSHYATRNLGVNPKSDKAASGSMKTFILMQQIVLRKAMALLLMALLLLAGLSGSFGLWAKEPSRNPLVAAEPVAVIAQSQLPSQGRSVLALIAAGGPFQHDKDGTVFGNRERLLPSNPRGFYREYTVRTPSERSRGARRIVCGGAQPTAPEACYYTADHYASFQKIMP